MASIVANTYIFIDVDFVPCTWYRARSLSVFHNCPIKCLVFKAANQTGRNIISGNPLVEGLDGLSLPSAILFQDVVENLLSSLKPFFSSFQSIYVSIQTSDEKPVKSWIHTCHNLWEIRISHHAR